MTLGKSSEWHLSLTRPLPWGLFAFRKDKGQGPQGPRSRQRLPTRASQGENSSGTLVQVLSLAN